MMFFVALSGRGGQAITNKLNLYEDEITKRLVEVCNRIVAEKDDFLIFCQQIMEMLSANAALNRKSKHSMSL